MPVALDQQHFDMRLFEQVEREHGARKARADDRDARRGAEARAGRMKLRVDYHRRLTILQSRPATVRTMAGRLVASRQMRFKVSKLLENAKAISPAVRFRGPSGIRRPDRSDRRGKAAGHGSRRPPPARS